MKKILINSLIFVFSFACFAFECDNTLNDYSKLILTKIDEGFVIKGKLEVVTVMANGQISNSETSFSYDDSKVVLKTGIVDYYSGKNGSYSVIHQDKSIFRNKGMSEFDKSKLIGVNDSLISQIQIVSCEKKNDKTLIQANYNQGGIEFELKLIFGKKLLEKMSMKYPPGYSINSLDYIFSDHEIVNDADFKGKSVEEFISSNKSLNNYSKIN